MKKDVKIEVPNSYSAVSLKKYLRLQKDLKAYEGDTKAQDAFLLWNLCGLTPEITNKLDVETLTNITNDLRGFLNKNDFELQRIVEIDGKKYGFEPNLSKLSYGAYLDISSFETLSIDENWSTIMSILYREVTKERGALYDIKAYQGYTDEDTERWMNVGMDIHFGAFFFFNRILTDLSKGILNSLKEEALMEKHHPFIRTILEKSGEAINRLSSSQTKI